MKHLFSLTLSGRFRRLLPVLALLAGSLATQAQNYQALTVTGYTADVVANGKNVSSVSTVTAAFDNPASTANGLISSGGDGNVLMELGHSNAAGFSATVGLPTGGLINSALTSGLPFQLASYSANNSLRLVTSSNGVLTLSKPQVLRTLYVLAASGSGAASMDVTVMFSDGTTQFFGANSVPDWYGGTNAAITGLGRTSLRADNIENNAANPCLYQTTLALSTANWTKAVTSVQVANNGSGILNVMGVSAAIAPTLTSLSPVSGPTGTNITLTGTNLTGATGVSFGGTAATTFTVVNATTVTVTVPAGNTSGLVTVTTPIGTSNGIMFTLVCPLPTAIAQNTTVALPANGTGILTATAVNNASTPTNCGTLTYQVQKVVYGVVSEGGVLTLTAPNGALFTAVTFASYGMPTGNGNGGYLVNSNCNSPNSQAVVASYLVGKNTASIFASSMIFGDPCPGYGKLLAVQAVYTAPATQVSYSCSDVAGPNYVLLTVTDANNNTSMATATVSVTAPAAATITGLSPASGAVGQTITVSGTNLGAATGLSVNGATAAISSNTGSSFTFVVPSGATATGNVVVSAPCLPASAAFTVAAPADLVVSTTTTIPAGTYNSITVTGTGNGTLAGNVIVNTSVTVQNGGTLNDGCFVLTGAGSFTLAAGGTLGICSAQGITPSGATGTVQLSGTRSFSTDASYVYNGSAAQNTGTGLPAMVRNLTTTNASNVTLSATTSVTQILTVASSGNLALNNQTLTLLATPTSTALVVNSGTGSVSGTTAVAQTYLDPTLNAGPGYRHLSTPVSNATVANFTTATFTPNVSQSSAYNASATPGTVTPFPNVFGYDQSRLASVTNNLSAFDKGFAALTSSSAVLSPGSGYVVNMAAGQVVSFPGQLINGSNTFTLARAATNSANAADAGWYLMGNLYPAPYDYSQVAAADRTGLDAAIYVFASTSQYAGNYRSFVNGVGSSSSSFVLAIGQAFWLRVSSGQTSGSYTFRNSQRLTTQSTTTLQRGTADARPLVQLELRGATGPADAFFAYAEAGATADFDPQLDAVKRANTTGLNLASRANGAPEGLAIDARPAFTAATVLPLSVAVPAAGTYTLSAAALRNLPTGLSAYLHDAATGQTLNLSQQPTYTFEVSATQAAAGLSTRFSLSFSPQAALATAAALSAEVSLFPNPAHASFTVLVPAVAGTSQLRAELLNTLGQLVRQLSAALPADGARLTVDTAGLAGGVYTMRLHVGPTTLVKRVVLQ